MPADSRTAEATMDAASLYREEIITDRKVGTIRLMVPVKSDGTPDTARPTIERTMRELQELRRQQSSGLIVPPAGAASALAGGGFPGGGKIQMP